MKEKLRKYWLGLPGPQKKKVVMACVIGGLLLLIGVGYKMSGRGNTPPPAPVAAKKTDASPVESDALKRNAQNESKKELAEAKEQMGQVIREAQELRDWVQRTKSAGVTKDGSADGPGKGLPLPAGIPGKGTPGGGQVDAQGMAGTPGLMPPPGTPGLFGTPVPQVAAAPPAPMRAIGDISIASNAAQPVEDKKKDDENLRVYLSPSFMPATLLTGMLAPTTDGGKNGGNPTPALLRITDLSILPNSVKRDLKGCFLVAEGVGSLQKERVDMRLITLSCITQKGQSVVEAKIKGYVVDNDGNVGVHGKVVAKFGSTLARSMIAGFFQGAGDAFKQAATTTTLTPLGGTTSTISSGDVLKAGLGSGVAAAAHDIQKFYLDLARNSGPVIEVLGQKQVTVVITEGTELELKPMTRVGGKKS